MKATNEKNQLVTWQLRYLKKVIVHDFADDEVLGYLLFVHRRLLAA